MKRPLILFVLVAIAGAAGFGTTSCSEPGESAAAESAPEAEILSEQDADMPSAEDARKDAEASINDANADAELEKLEKELAEEGGG